MRRLSIAFAIAALLVVPAVVLAQAAPSPHAAQTPQAAPVPHPPATGAPSTQAGAASPQAASAPAATGAASPATGTTPTAASAQAPATPAPPPPVLVVPLADPHIDASVVTAIRDAVVQALGGVVRGRPVEAVTDATHLQAIAACSSPVCVGGKVAEARGIAGVLLRLHHGHPRTAIDMQIDVVDPISGAPHGEPVHVAIPREAQQSPQALITAAVGQLASRMPAPPVHTTLLLAVNADGAQVRVDGHPVGRSPLAPFDIAPGGHVVTVEASGYDLFNEHVDVSTGDDARVNVDLHPNPAALATEQPGEATTTQSRPSPPGPWYTRWYVLAGAGVGVALIVTAIIVIATSGGGQEPRQGFPLPPIQ